MYIIDNVYIDNNINDSQNILNSLLENKPVFNIFCICIDENSRNIAEIMSSREVLVLRNKKRDLIVIGISYGRAGGERLFFEILSKYLNEGNRLCDFKNYILKQGVLLEKIN